MSFAKAVDLMQLATTIAARRSGVTIRDVEEQFSVVRRTAQRMLSALERVFPQVYADEDDEGRKHWHLPKSELRDLIDLTAEELASYDLAVEAMRKSGQMVDVEMLSTLREKLMALVPPAKALRLETDHEALLEAQGLASRPGPRPRFDVAVAQSIAEAIKACLVLQVLYQSRSDAAPRWRGLEPLGILTGLRRYLIAKEEGDEGGLVRLFRIDAFREVRSTDRPFVRDPDFSLRAFANRAFGVYQRDDEFGEVVWRFAPEAADHAHGFEFHPEQILEDQEDGSLIVRFRASGHLEMCWHLYAWGDKVEVLAPERLRRLVDGYQRSDFPAFP
jgi:predicted DNA-binding transcriptional regulator YafY